jgi:hypothetical protein
MYLALFLMPWMLMYALSTLAMNHRALFEESHGPGPAPFEIESERSYDASFPPDAPPAAVGALILRDLGMEGRFGARRIDDGKRLVINRNDPVTPRRITYAPAERKLVVERQTFRTNAFLEQLHRRRGYGSGFALDDAWAGSVDLVIVAMVFWVASGIWMWWEIRVARWWGAAAALFGLLLFLLFLFTI